MLKWSWAMRFPIASFCVKTKWGVFTKICSAGSLWVYCGVCVMGPMFSDNGYQFFICEYHISYIFTYIWTHGRQAWIIKIIFHDFKRNRRRSFFCTKWKIIFFQVTSFLNDLFAIPKKTHIKCSYLCCNRIKCWRTYQIYVLK